MFLWNPTLLLYTTISVNYFQILLTSSFFISVKIIWNKCSFIQLSSLFIVSSFLLLLLVLLLLPFHFLGGIVVFTVTIKICILSSVYQLCFSYWFSRLYTTVLSTFYTLDLLNHSFTQIVLKFFISLLVYLYISIVLLNCITESQENS